MGTGNRNKEQMFTFYMTVTITNYGNKYPEPADPDQDNFCKFARAPLDSGSGSRINIPDLISESLVVRLKFFVANPDPGLFHLGSGTDMKKFESGIIIPDPRHSFRNQHIILKAENTLKV